MVMKFAGDQVHGTVDDKRFVAWFVDDFMTEHFPEAFERVERKALLSMTRNGIRYARHFGFAKREEQTHFLALMNDVGPDFWRFPGFQEIISNQVAPPMKRIDEVYGRVTGAQFEAALNGSDPNYWFPHLVEDHVLGPEWHERSTD